MAYEHTTYENFVLENKFEDILTTAVDLNGYITADYSLAEAPGMKKVINKYTATGSVEDLEMGEGNSEEIVVSFTPDDYTVGVTQGKFGYYDEQALTDPMVVEAGLKGLAQTMANDFTAKAIAEFDKSENIIYDATWSYDDIVDAVAKFGENETGLFLLISPEIKAAFRKKLGDSLQYTEATVRSGYIGSVCGVPVVVSKAVPEKKAYMATRDAVTAFIKKGSEIEQERDADTRLNTVFARKVAVVALTDERKCVVLTSDSKS